MTQDEKQKELGEVVLGIEPRLPESESGVITITKNNPLVERLVTYLLHIAKS
jgi:hypothetical protein